MLEETAQNQEQKQPEYFYDATVEQKFPFQIPEDGELYPTAHHYKVLNDDRYLEFVRAIRVKGNEDEIKSDTISAQNKLWNDLVREVENFATDEADWQSVIDYENEKQPSLQHFLAVAIVEPETLATGVRRKSASDKITVITEAYFDGKPVKQKHVLHAKKLEWSKKYDNIQSNRMKPEKVGGLRGTPDMIAVAQDDKLGSLYDEMFESQEGFVGGVIPLRFKTRVIDYIFKGSGKLDPKKSATQSA
jgi:hypothetical protein